MKNKKRYVGYAAVTGSFAVIGVEHSFVNGTLTVSKGDDTVVVYTDVLQFTVEVVAETDKEKIDRLEKEVTSLKEEIKKDEKEHNALIQKKNTALKSIITLSYEDNIPRFGKKKVFEAIYNLADNARSNWVD